MRILIDLDGVLVNFHEYVLRLFGREDLINDYPKGQSWLPDVLGITVQEFWDRVPDTLFAELPPMHDYDILLAGLKIFDPVFWVATTAGPSIHAPTFKIAWMKQYLGKDFNRYNILGGGPSKEEMPNKDILVGPDKILIDDFDGNVDSFRAAGGKAVLVPRPWNSKWQESDIAAKVVLESVTELISQC